MVEIKTKEGVQDVQVEQKGQESSDLPAAKIEAALKYQGYLDEYKHRPAFMRNSRPMTQEEFVNVQTEIVGPLEELAELARQAINNKKAQ